MKGGRARLLAVALGLVVVLVALAASTRPTPAGPRPDVGIPEVSTEKNCYLPGETVSIVLTNVGTGFLFYARRPNFVVENGTIGIVRDAIGGYPPETVRLRPGDNLTFSWDGKWDRTDGAHKGELVPPGDYDVVVQVLAGFPIPDLVEIDRTRIGVGPCQAQIHAGDDRFVQEGEAFRFAPVIHITGNATVTSITWDLDPATDTNGDGNATNDIDLVGENPEHAFGDDGTFPVVMNLRGFGTIQSKTRVDQDVVFSIDSSGSMATSDPLEDRKSVV